MASLCSNPFNLKNKITKIEHQKILRGPSKILKNISWSMNICLIYFMTPQKPCCPPPTYLMYGPSPTFLLMFLRKKQKNINPLMLCGNERSYILR